MNEKIIEVFKRLLKYIKKDKYRYQSLKKSLEIISNFKEEIVSINQLKNIKGIGKGTLKRVDEILKTGTLSFFENEKIINELLKIMGMGHKKAELYVKKYNIKSLKHFKQLVNNEEIEVSNEIKLGLKYYGKIDNLIPRKIIIQIEIELKKITYEFDKNYFITICGSYRRGYEYSSDIDVLLVDMSNVIEYDVKKFHDFIKFLHKNKIIIDDITNKNYKTKYMGYMKHGRIDIRLIPIINYPYALLYFTGSFQFNQMMRHHAKQLGYKLNEYGLYKNDEFLYVENEEDIFKILNMKYYPPSKRDL